MMLIANDRIFQKLKVTSFPHFALEVKKNNTNLLYLASDIIEIVEISKFGDKVIKTRVIKQHRNHQIMQ